MTEQELNEKAEQFKGDVDFLIKSHITLAGKYNLLKGAILIFGENATKENWEKIEEIINAN